MKNIIRVVVFAVFALFVCCNTSCLATQNSQYSFVTSVRASHILVDTKEQAEAIKIKIDQGASFETMAKKYSKCPSAENGGDLGYFERGQMVVPFEDVAFQLPVGQVSEPVRTQFGWHLIKVYDRK